MTDLQQQLNDFVDEYNNRRPHSSIGRTTPVVAYNRLPKNGPGGSTAGIHYRIRHDRIDDTGCVSLRRAGRMHHIGIGRAHSGTPVVLLIDDLNIRVIATQTGEMLRTLELNPNTGYQPQTKN